MAQKGTYHARLRIVGHNKLAEQDLIITAIDNEGAQVQAVAKGARKPTGKLAALTQSFNTIDALLAKGKSLDILCEGKTVFQPLKDPTDLDVTSALSLLAEAAKKLSFKGEENPYLAASYDAATAIIQQLNMADLVEKHSKLNVLLAAFIFKNYANLGWMPNLENCAQCNNSQTIAFSVEAGGLICEQCWHLSPDGQCIEQEHKQLLNDLLHKRFQTVLQAELSAELALWALVTTVHWAEHYGDTHLKASEFYLSLQ